MGELRPRQLHPDVREALTELAVALTVDPDPAPVVLNLTDGGKRRDVVRSCVCWLEELNNGKTEVHLKDGSSVKVDEGPAAVEALLTS